MAAATDILNILASSPTRDHFSRRINASGVDDVDRLSRRAFLARSAGSRRIICFRYAIGAE